MSGASRAATVPEIALYLQPVQDLTIEDRVSRTQYQFTLDSSNPDDLSIWVPRLVDRLRQLPQLGDVAADSQERRVDALHRVRILLLMLALLIVVNALVA